MKKKSKSKKTKSGGEVSFFDKTFFQTLGKFDQKVSRKKVLGIVLAAILIVSISTGVAASSISDTDQKESKVESETVRDEDAVRATSAEDLNLNIVSKKIFKNPKMESILAYTVYVSESKPAISHEFANTHGLDVTDNNIRVVIEVTNEDIDPLTVQSLENKYKNIKVETTYKNYIQALVPVSELKGISENPSVRYIRCPWKPVFDITSEGVGVINATELHNISITGENVTIAVIDGGFKNYTINPEIPAENIIEVKSFRGDGKINATEHGTACAETILDVAPNASLYLLAMGTDLEFANATNYAIQQGVDVISCSGGWLVAPFDGTGFLCNIANNASDNGILFVNSAGNSAGRHYGGNYNDTDGDKWHEFSTSPKDETLLIGNIPAYHLIGFYLSWDDWPYSDQDYDLYFYFYYAGKWYYIKSDSLQTGTQPPVEGIAGYLEISIKNSYIKIKRYSATRDVHFQLYSAYQNLKEHNVPSSSLTSPADAEGVMTVGATYWKDGILESFSSQGPTKDGRTKPDVVAPDGTSSWVYGLSTGNHDADWSAGTSFFGTSASAPHVAGAAALLLSNNHSLTADQLQSALEETAVDLGAPGKDNLYGSGRINLSVDSTPPIYDPYDVNQNCKIEMVELMNAISDWKLGSYDMVGLMTTIGRWKAGSYC